MEKIVDHVDQLSSLVVWPNLEEVDNTKLRTSLPDHFEQKEGNSNTNETDSPIINIECEDDIEFITL